MIEFLIIIGISGIVGITVIAIALGIKLICEIQKVEKKEYLEMAMFDSELFKTLNKKEKEECLKMMPLFGENKNKYKGNKTI